ncbi:Flavanone 3-dioxygenase 3 [Camellia lanceoleosa]|uniref:Flavanone 3-dioxygenase 3 n=1 Tax=Camellia lanceoleosa TaxID=1840588 RepID=A0ACC0H370_9ERIC|nr:Flavanone 3-dioxygenase 3 [Camellia lanceoleosa]
MEYVGMLNDREKMGECAMAETKLALEIMGAITESLGIGPASLKHKMKEGMQVMVANGYPPCPQPSLSLGLPPHSDYSFITILLQSSCGFEILNIEDGEWRVVPELKGALQVHVGDHLEVLSSGMYKSVVHRATLNEKKTRFSIASLHSLGMNEKMGNAKELVNELHPIGYKESSFRDFLKFLGKNDVWEKVVPFISPDINSSRSRLVSQSGLGG